MKHLQPQELQPQEHQPLLQQPGQPDLSVSGGVFHGLYDKVRGSVGRRVVVGLLAAGSVLPTAACGGSSTPTPKPSAEASVSATGKEKSIDFGLDFTNLPPEVALVAKPVQVTPRAAEKSAVLAGIEQYFFPDFSDFTKNVAKARKAVDKTPSTDIKEAGKNLVDARITQGILSLGYDLFTYEDTKRWRESNAEAIQQADSAVAVLGEGAPKQTAQKARDYMIISKILEASSQNGLTQALAAAIADPQLKAELATSLGDKQKVADFKKKIADFKAQVQKEEAAASELLFTANEYDASSINFDLDEYTKAHNSQPDSTFPAAKDALLNAANKLNSVPAERLAENSAALGKLLDAAPPQYAPLVGSARTLVDARLLGAAEDFDKGSALDAKPSDATNSIILYESLVDAIANPTTKNIANTILDIAQAKAAQRALGLRKSDVAEVMIAGIEDAAVKELALKANGGDAVAQNELETMRVKLTDDARTPHAAAMHMLTAGSNSQAAKLNQDATDYLAQR